MMLYVVMVLLLPGLVSASGRNINVFAGAEDQDFPEAMINKSLYNDFWYRKNPGTLKIHSQSSISNLMSLKN